MSEIVLNCPRVKDLVDRLLSLNQDKEIVIEDADTAWIIDVIHIDNSGKKVVLYGTYGEMTHENI
uniref:Uncharacterized protein n=1 Tax=viral metagenome TaxID=1070528 RepID=A0A6H2A1X3_9ZZZZ